MALRAVDDHPKLSRLKFILHCGRGEAMGYLEAMWHFAGRYTPQGNIGKYTDADIEAWIEWEGDAGMLMQAFITSGWIDESDHHRLLVHDWHEHADDATRLSLKRKKLSFLTNSHDIVQTVSLQSSDSVATVSGLPGAVPEPVPEPVNSPSARETQFAESTATQFAEDFTPLEYARGILENAAIVFDRDTWEACAESIRLLAKTEHTPISTAAEVIQERSIAAQKAGEMPKPKFWFKDGDWKKPARAAPSMAQPGYSGDPDPVHAEEVRKDFLQRAIRKQTQGQRLNPLDLDLLRQAHLLERTC
jgi:hypothetical protein